VNAGWNGGCHCGAVRLRVERAPAAADVRARACSCSFCSAHAPRWWSDPASRCALEGGGARSYRFGSRSAEFLFCADCGCLVCAACRIDDADYAVINLNCVEPFRGRELPLQRCDYAEEDLPTRIARRKRNWMPLERRA
jgi:hypothetical protein